MINSAKYSGVYEQLVKDNSDLAGHIAYSLYKQRKRNFIISKQRELNMQDIPEEIMNDFIKQQDDEMLGYYRERAEAVLREFLDSSYGSELSREKRQIEKKFRRENSFWYGVAQSVIGSFIFITLGYFALKFSGIWEILLAKLLS